MMREGQMVLVVVEDDGIGIQTRASSLNRCFGLAGIKERISVLGGVARVISSKGKGTRIEITVPAGEPVTTEAPPAQMAARAVAPLN
jgi:signal transduction histidine kinase